MSVYTKRTPAKSGIFHGFTKNCCVTWNIREYANFVSNLLAYLIQSFTSFQSFTSAAVNS